MPWVIFTFTSVASETVTEIQVSAPRATFLGEASQITGLSAGVLVGVLVGAGVVGWAVGVAVTVTVGPGLVGNVLGVRPSIVANRSVWSITPVTLAACGPIAATRIWDPVCVACCGGAPA